MALSHWWGPTFSSWPGNYSCCHGEMGDSPHICYHGNREVAHIRLIYSALLSSLVLHNTNVSPRQEVFTQAEYSKHTVKYSTQQWYTVHHILNCKLVLTIAYRFRHIFTKCWTIQKRVSWRKPQVVTWSDNFDLKWYYWHKWSIRWKVFCLSSRKQPIIL